MRVSLSTSLHLDHGSTPLDAEPGDPPRMQSFVPVGLLSLKAAADHAGTGADVRVVEVNGLLNDGRIPNDDRLYEHLALAALEAGDDFVGLMTDADSLPHTVLTARAVKRLSPRTPVCLGGPGSSPIAGPLLERFPFLSMVARGEGEETFVELLRALKAGRRLDGTAGLVWRDGETVVHGGERPVAPELDTLPVPDFAAYDMDAGAPLYLDVGRGCPFRCSFCATAPFWRRRFRMKSIDRIVHEMRLVRERWGRTHVNFSHDIFTCDKRWTLEFCERLRAEALDVTWACSTRTDIIDPPTLEAMARAGCVEMYFGIEAGSHQGQAEIQKGLDLEWSRTVVAAAAGAGIRPITGFIVGQPSETPATLGATLERFFDFLRVGGFRAHLFTLCPFHEAPMFATHAASIDRRAQYIELPLAAGPAREHGRMRDENRDLFASQFRYATPGVPERWVDASEELSSHVVVLKALWPLLLPHYESALDWYGRWVDWIEAANARRRPGSRLRHQGDAYDLLDFVDREIVRLGLADSGVAELAAYERAKLEARELPDPAPAGVDGGDGDGAVVARRGGYVARRIRYDLASLLGGGAGERLQEGRERWVVVTKTEPGFMATLQVGPAGLRLLDLAERPRPAGELLDALEADGRVERTEAAELLRRFRDRGVLAEVAR
ncbi:MAG TPA: radical SAM protein [Longimicrobium sp.]|jgi:hypothetical protein